MFIELHPLKPRQGQTNGACLREGRLEKGEGRSVEAPHDKPSEKARVQDFKQGGGCSLPNQKLSRDISSPITAMNIVIYHENSRNTENECRYYLN